MDAIKVSVEGRSYNVDPNKKIKIGDWAYNPLRDVIMCIGKENLDYVNEHYYLVLDDLDTENAMEDLVCKYGKWFPSCEKEKLMSNMRNDLKSFVQIQKRSQIIDTMVMEKECKNCLYHNVVKHQCKHPNWENCIKRNDHGVVVDYVYHDLRQ